MGWQLLPVEMEYPEGLERYKLFSRFLLEGQVLHIPRSTGFGSLNNCLFGYRGVFNLRVMNICSVIILNISQFNNIFSSL